MTILPTTHCNVTTTDTSTSEEQLQLCRCKISVALLHLCHQYTCGIIIHVCQCYVSVTITCMPSLHVITTSVSPPYISQLPLRVNITRTCYDYTGMTYMCHHYTCVSLTCLTRAGRERVKSPRGFSSSTVPWHPFAPPCGLEPHNSTLTNLHSGVGPPDPVGSTPGQDAHPFTKVNSRSAVFTWTQDNI